MRMTRTIKWGLVALFWLGWSAACTSFSYSWRLAINHPIDWISLAPLYVAAYAVWGVFSVIVVHLAQRFTLERAKWFRSVLVHLLGALCVAGLHALITSLLNPWIWPDMTTKEAFSHAMQRNFLMMGSDDIFIYFTIVFTVQGWMYYQRYRDRELRTSVLETQLAKAQLMALKVQLHPHFLFNTLNSITELMHSDVHVAERVITRLSDLLRMTLENIGTQEVSLRDELDFVRGYLEIEQMRFQDRLHIDYQIAPETLDARVPNLMLQPLVENAVRHGISKSSKLGLILLKTEIQGTRLCVYIRDNGPGLKTNGHSPAANFGIGLSTTRTRLEFLYGKDHSLELNNLPTGGLEVRLVVPFQASLKKVEVPHQPLTNSMPIRPTLEGVRS